jgi:hypothetical protein
MENKITRNYSFSGEGSPYGVVPEPKASCSDGTRAGCIRSHGLCGGRVRQEGDDNAYIEHITSRALLVLSPDDSVTARGTKSSIDAAILALTDFSNDSPLCSGRFELVSSEED